MAASLIVALKLTSLLTLAILLAAFFYAISLWWSATLYRRLEHYFPWFFFPLQVTNGLLYLLRMAFNSFLRHGRRPGHPHFGYYQVGQLYNWTMRIYDEEETPHDWMRHYYDTWISAANSVLFDSWMGEQNMTLFFRWGSFARYLFLWSYYVFHSFLGLSRRLWHSELLLLMLLFLWRMWPILCRMVYLPFWWLSQGAFRFALAMAGEFHISIAMVFLKLEPFLRFQWFQQDNVDEYDSPLKLYRRPLPLPFYRFFWYSHQRQQQDRWYRFSYHWPAICGIFSSLFAIFFLTLLLLPFAFLSVFLLGSYSLSQSLSRGHYRLYQRLLSRASGAFLHLGQDAALWLFSLIFFALASVTLNLWSSFLQTLMAVGRIMARGVAFVGLVIAVAALAPFDFQPFLTFGFGYIFVEFLQQLLPLLVPLKITGDTYGSLSFDTFLAAANIHELKTDWQEEALYHLGEAYHGHLWRGFHTSWIDYPNPPWLPPKRKPEIWVSWWHRPANWWYWQRPLFNGGPPERRPAAGFLYSFQQSLYYNSTVAYEAINQDRENAGDWYSLLMDATSAKEIVWRIPLEGLEAAASYVYYFLAYRFFYSRDGFYWLRLAYWYPFYTFCFSFSLVLDWAVEWPLYRLRVIIRSWAVFSPTLSGFLSTLLHFFSRSLQQLVNLSQATLALLADSFRPSISLPANPVSYLWQFTLPGAAHQRWSRAFTFLWNFSGGWGLWYLSIIFDELLRGPLWGDLYRLLRAPSSSLLFFRLCLLAPLDLWSVSKALSLEDRRSSLWTMALSLYLWVQQFWDRAYVPLQLPRFLDDYSLSYRDRRPRRAWLFEKLYATTTKGAFTANRRWRLPAVFLYRHSSLLGWQIREHRTHQHWFLAEPVAFAWLNPKFAGGLQPELQPFLSVQDLWILDLAYLPFYVDDGLSVFLMFLPFLYVAAILLFLGLFPGSSNLLFDRPAPGSTTAIFNRQWAWDSCRYDQPFDDFETLFYRPMSVVLEDAKVENDYPWKRRSRYFFRRLYSRYLKILGQPALLAQWPQKRSLGSGKAYFLDLFYTDRRVLLPFANYLFLAKHKSIRRNFLNHGIDFLRFISINFRRNPWVSRSFNQYDQYDYHTWLRDANMDFAQRAVEAGARTRRHLEKIDRLLFQKQLSHWVWYKDIGNQEFERTSDAQTWQELAYEVDDKDGETYFPWGPLWWFLMFPFYLFNGLYLDLEMAWNQDALFPGGGTLELRRMLLWYHSFFGHIAMFYQHMEWHGWWYFAEYQRADNALTDPDELPFGSYYNRWNKGEGSSFYPVPMYCFQPLPSSIAPWGTSQPIGLLEEYYWARLFVWLLPLLMLPWVLRYTRSTDRFLLAFHARWPLFARQFDSLQKIYLWFWK